LNHFKNKYVILATMIVLSTIISSAQQYNFKTYTTQNGLVGSQINNIFQDSKGFIWFATTSGVSRFNGKTFQNYTTNEGLVSNNVTFITEDKTKNIWIATTAGVSKFDGSKFKNYTTKEGLTKDEVFCIYVDNQNKIWLAINEGGINILEHNSIKAISKKEGLPDERVFSIIQDQRGDFWFTMQKGIVKYDGVHFGVYDTTASYNKILFWSSMLDSKGNVWFGGENYVLKYDGNGIKKLDLPANTLGYISCSEDKRGNIWFATSNGALKFEDNLYKLFTEKEGLSLNDVYAVKCDNEGNIWIGTNGGGVNLFNNEAFVNYTDKEELNSKEVTSIASNQQNSEYYVGGGLGLYILQPHATQKFRLVNEIKELNGVKINCINRDINGLIWVGTSEGFYVLEKIKDKFKLLKKYNQIEGQNLLNVTKIICDKYGNNWIATQSSGLFLVNEKVAKSFSTINGFYSNFILTVFDDHNANIWVGTQDAGIVKYDGKTFKHYALKQGFPDLEVWSIAEDDQGHLFFGTKNNGPVSFNGKKFKSYTKDMGLLSNYIKELKWDPINKCLWVGSDNGINRVKFNNELEIYDLRNYGDREGFKGIEVSLNSSFIDNKGLLWLGSINGLTCYNSKYDLPNTTPPKVYIKDVLLNYKQVDWRKYKCQIDAGSNLPVNLELSYKNNHLTFNFQALTTDNVKYSYKLEGQDQEWSPLSENSEADYNNITPGKTYTFKVKAVNSYGNWSNEITNFTFTINAPWYATWWAYLIYIITGLGSLILFFKWRTANLKERQKILEATVIERTIELDTSNKQLSHAFQEIKDSINYAQKIQTAILPLDEDIKNELEDSFVLFKPRDVVSGDFYWFYTKDEKILIAAVDCTGHGVPGAFMSMIGYSLLNEIVSKEDNLNAAQILNKLHEGVRKSLKQNRDIFESKDGMDIALTVIDKASNTLQYAGAKRPLFYYNGQTFMETKADKQSIGGLEIEHDFNFTNNNFDLKKGDTFYMFTDGYIDQFGGEKDKKFSTLRLKSTLQELQHLSLKEQGIKLENIINDWKNNTEQTDDILVIGFRF
jgi:ligand-binding sensor domain-containing protein/serine phosphatase RsbU (regulator of sigma subunit)